VLEASNGRAEALRIAVLVEDVESETAVWRKRTVAKPLGVAAVLAQNPLQRPKKTKKPPVPAFHAASKPSVASSGTPTRG